MEELIVTKEQLMNMFISKDIEDSEYGWIYQNTFYVNIIALHEKAPKYVFDITDAEYYKISLIQQK
ncbi:MAG: hypothetical protein L0Y61_02325 [Epsilonproteobacteria bacterium]|nr:hypothetical protein [Campylobacterota bacterium]